MKITKTQLTSLIQEALEDMKKQQEEEEEEQQGEQAELGESTDLEETWGGARSGASGTAGIGGGGSSPIRPQDVGRYQPQELIVDPNTGKIFNKFKKAGFDLDKSGKGMPYEKWSKLHPEVQTLHKSLPKMQAHAAGVERKKGPFGVSTGRSMGSDTGGSWDVGSAGFGSTQEARKFIAKVIKEVLAENNKVTSAESMIRKLVQEVLAESAQNAPKKKPPAKPAEPAKKPAPKKK